MTLVRMPSLSNLTVDSPEHSLCASILFHVYPGVQVVFVNSSKNPEDIWIFFASKRMEFMRERAENSNIKIKQYLDRK